MKDKHTTAEILRWYLYSGVDETIGEVPQNRFINVNLKEDTPTKKEQINNSSKIISQGSVMTETSLQEAGKIAAAAKSGEELKNTLLNYAGFSLRKTATNLVFGDGNFSNIPLGSFRSYYRVSDNEK